MDKQFQTLSVLRQFHVEIFQFQFEFIFVRILTFSDDNVFLDPLRRENILQIRPRRDIVISYLVGELRFRAPLLPVRQKRAGVVQGVAKKPLIPFAEQLPFHLISVFFQRKQLSVRPFAEFYPNVALPVFIAVEIVFFFKARRTIAKSIVYGEIFSLRFVVIVHGLGENLRPIAAVAHSEMLYVLLALRLVLKEHDRRVFIFL